MSEWQSYAWKPAFLSRGMDVQPGLSVHRSPRAGNLKGRAGDGMTVFSISSDPFYPLPAKGKERRES